MKTKHTKPSVFISYRRDDSGNVTGRIRDSLEQLYASGEFFYDVDSLDPGESLNEGILAALDSAKVLLVVIGPHWATIEDEHGNPRLHQTDDYVRLEVATGLNKKGLYVIPVLVNDASKPDKEQLPRNLWQLCDRLGIKVRIDPDYYQDINNLCQILRRVRPRIRTSSVVLRRRWLKGIVGAIVPLTLLAIGYVMFSKPSHEEIVRESAEKIFEFYSDPAEQIANPKFDVFADFDGDEFLFNEYRLRQAVFLTVSDWQADPRILNEALNRLAEQKRLKNSAGNQSTIVNVVKKEWTDIVTERKKFLLRASKAGELEATLPIWARSLSEFDRKRLGLSPPTEKFSSYEEIERELKLISNANPKWDIEQ